ncbi:putative cadherin [Schistosoma mansoni]|uniref:putative cadherin n=1 Tax=Schistosoma mansoni TaxID=6183 RepID=UPI0001A63CFA|nr:putative cadherin [Schistosoma mansoni]|eukprot:XP_018650764.1 putative cadherin [Schistosoma mansoni]
MFSLLAKLFHNCTIKLSYTIYFLHVISFINYTITFNPIVLRDNTRENEIVSKDFLLNYIQSGYKLSLLQSSKGREYFDINENHQLITSRFIDRDKLCLQSRLCCPLEGSTTTITTTSTISSNIGSFEHTNFMNYQYNYLSHTTSRNNIHGLQTQSTYYPNLCSAKIDDTESLYNPMCTFNLTVSVMTSPSEVPDTHQITIIICDENDHVPQFKHPKDHLKMLLEQKSLPASSDGQPILITNLSEASPVGSRIVLPLAEDLDSSPFNVQRYELENLDHLNMSESDLPTFQLNYTKNIVTSSDGHYPSHSIGHVSNDRTESVISKLELVLLKPLNREEKDKYKLRILAIDGGQPSQTGTLYLFIHVLDINDHAPVFNQSVYEIHVSEGIINKTILQLSATDADDGENAVIIYKFPKGSEWITSISSSLLTSNDVVNVNQYPPGYWFHLDDSTGRLSIQRPLDYETKSEHILEVLAYNPPSVLSSSNHRISSDMTATAKIIVKVDNEYDEPPFIQIDYSNEKNEHYKHVTENSMNLYFIAFIIVTDPDYNDNNNYHLHSSSSSISSLSNRVNSASLSKTALISCKLETHDEFYSLFESDNYKLNKANEVRYVLQTIKSLDREIGDENRIVISCTDSDIPPKTSTATVVVSEIAVIDPDIFSFVQLDDIYYPGLLEKQTGDYFGKSSSSFSQIPKQQQQQHQHKGLQVRIDPGHGRRDLPFTLHEIGNGRYFLNTTRPLDRETEEAFQFIIVATDNEPVRHTASLSVIVNVIDVNDNRPEIIFPNPMTSNSTVHRLSYRVYAGHEIISINANDRDADQFNGKFHFEMVQDLKSSDLFTIDRDNGMLKTRRTLTKDDLGEYQVHIIVRDEGQPSLETQLLLRLLIDQSEPQWASNIKNNRNYQFNDFLSSSSSSNQMHNLLKYKQTNFNLGSLTPVSPICCSHSVVHLPISHNNNNQQQRREHHLITNSRNCRHRENQDFFVDSDVSNALIADNTSSFSNSLSPSHSNYDFNDFSRKHTSYVTNSNHRCWPINPLTVNIPNIVNETNDTMHGSYYHFVPNSFGVEFPNQSKKNFYRGYKPGNGLLHTYNVGEQQQYVPNGRLCYINECNETSNAHLAPRNAWDASEFEFRPIKDTINSYQAASFTESGKSDDYVRPQVHSLHRTPIPDNDQYIGNNSSVCYPQLTSHLSVWKSDPYLNQSMHDLIKKQHNKESNQIWTETNLYNKIGSTLDGINLIPEYYGTQLKRSKSTRHTTDKDLISTKLQNKPMPFNSNFNNGEDQSSKQLRMITVHPSSDKNDTITTGCHNNSITTTDNNNDIHCTKTNQMSQYAISFPTVQASFV